VLNAAWKMDTVGNKVAKPGDRHDQGGRAQHGLPGDRLGDAGARRRRRQRRLRRWPRLRQLAHLRFADGPDEVHRNQIGKLELARYLANKA
jgi:acyl-CoA dehydrogenase